MFIIRQKTQFKENQNAESLPCKSFCFYSCHISHVRLGPSAGMTVTHQYSDCSLNGQFGSPVFSLGEELQLQLAAYLLQQELGPQYRIRYSFCSSGPT